MRIGYLSTRTLDSGTRPPRLSNSPLIARVYLLAREHPGLESSRNRMLRCGSFRLDSPLAPVKWYFLTPSLAQHTVRRASRCSDTPMHQALTWPALYQVYTETTNSQTSYPGCTLPTTLCGPHCLLLAQRPLAKIPASHGSFNKRRNCTAKRYTRWPKR